MELMADLAENKSASMHSPQGFQLLGGGKCLGLVGRHPSPLEGEGAVVLEPCGESYECGCGGNSRTPSIRSTLLRQAFLRHAPAIASKIFPPLRFA